MFEKRNSLTSSLGDTTISGGGRGKQANKRIVVANYGHAGLRLKFVVRVRINA